MKVVLFRDYKEENWHSMEVYADELAKHLRAQYRDLKIQEFVTLAGVSKMFPAQSKYMRQFFRYVVNPIGASFQKADIYHITDHANAQLLAVLDSKKTVITCHDLTAPYWMETHVKLTVKKRIRHAVEKWRLEFMKRAAKVIAVSNATKEHIIQELQIPKEKIAVIPEGVDVLFSPVTRRRLDLPKKYVVHMGTTYTNKNIEGLLHIFFTLARNDRDLFLVKCGDPWTDKQCALIEQSTFARRVRHLGFVPIEDLPEVYSRSIALVQPSYAEGFGFTVLEAMACGCPVIISDIPAMREMVGSAGFYISPDPAPHEVAIIASLLHSPTALARMKRLGVARSKIYSWRKTAKKTYELYQDIVSGRGKPV